MMTDINSAWQELKDKIAVCTKCELCETRHKTVPGIGSLDCRIVVIGEAPGKEEDETGEPFVGPAGQLLTDILEKGGNISRSSLYITNVVKCRPPNNRNPNPEEISACSEYLEAQLLLLHPDIVVTMGNVPTQALLNIKKGITDLRGKWIDDWRGIKLFPMFHPSYLLRNQSNSVGSPRYLMWQDVRELKAKIDTLENEGAESN